MAIIMLRAGLGLDLDKLRKMGAVTLRLAFLPCFRRPAAPAFCMRPRVTEVNPVPRLSPSPLRHHQLKHPAAPARTPDAARALLTCSEALVIAILAAPILDLPAVWGGVLGFVIAAVSPAVVVPGMLDLQERGARDARFGTTCQTLHWHAASQGMGEQRGYPRW